MASAPHFLHCFRGEGCFSFGGRKHRENVRASKQLGVNSRPPRDRVEDEVSELREGLHARNARCQKGCRPAADAGLH